MKIIVCIDERGGMAFNRRRQSRDARVSEDVLRTACGRLVVYPYSARLLEEAVSALAPATDGVGGTAAFRVSEDALGECGEDEYVLVEDRAIGGYAERADGMIIYNWNRHYPADLRLDVSPEALGMRLISRDELVGRAHERITKEVYGK